MQYDLKLSGVFCAYNAEGRIAGALQAFSQAILEIGIKSEAIVIANGCSDRTVSEADFALRKFFIGNGRLITLKNAGKSAALAKGLNMAQGKYVMIVDDDNHIRAKWVSDSIRALEEVPKLGIVGCNVNGVWPQNPPIESEEIGQFLAIGHQCTSDVLLCTEPRVFETESVWGAGSTIRVSAWRSILESGFKFQLRGRIEGRSVAGEDTEMCCAIRMAGWKCGVANEVGLDHLMSPQRTKRAYWDSVATGAGVASSVLSLYSENRRTLERMCGRFSQLHLALEAFSALTIYAAQSVHPRRRGMLRRLQQKYSLGRASAYLFHYAQLKNNAQNIMAFRTAIERTHSKLK